MFRKIIFTISAALLVIACTAQADIIIYNGEIFTGDKTTPFIEAVAVKGERIVATGTSIDIRKLATPNTKVIDAGGRLVTPGINDAHDHVGHLPFGRPIGFKQPMLEGPALNELIDSIKAIVATLEPGSWITGNIGLNIIEDQNARRSVLDIYSPQHPILLNAPWGHGTLINTAAMRLLNIPFTKADPAGGNYERYAGSDTINGLLHEYAGFTVRQPLVANVPDEVTISNFQRYANNAARLGITSVQNMATGLQAEQMERTLVKAKLPVRMRVINFPGSPTASNYQYKNAKGKPGNMLLFSGTKWIIDGTPLERKALMRNEYADKPGWRGELNFQGDTLDRILQLGFNSREQLLLHISGDSTPAVILDRMKVIANGSQWNKKRVRFEHADGLISNQLPLVKQMGIVAVINPMHFTFAEANHKRMGRHASRYQPVRSLIEAGIPVAIGSDGPNNPWLNIMFATIHPSNPAEAITREQALTAYTYGSAYAEFMEKEKGQIKKGMLADIIILSQDILTVPPNALPGTKSLMTIVNGKIIHNELQ